MTTDQGTASRRRSDGVGPAETATATGLAAALVGAIPIVGPALAAGCLSCVGVGAAAGLGATGALPPLWWLAGLAVTAVAVIALDARTARRCDRPPRPIATLGVLAATATVAWLATRYRLVPGIDWLTGPAPVPGDGPTLP